MRKLENITDNICTILSDYLVSEGFEYEPIIATQFEYNYLSDTIGIALLIHDEMGKYFIEYAKENGLHYDVGTFLLSFFHEVGHGESYDWVTDLEYRESAKIKSTLKPTYEDSIIYFNLPEEKLATMWAINYINENQKKVSILAKELIPYFEEIKENYHLVLDK